MEELNIIDENDNVIGKDVRENIHKNGLLHREIHVWIYNKNSEILFQRRAKDKDTYPDLLDASVGGHVEIDDDYLTTAVKELEEETGIKAEANDLIYITKMRRSSVDEKTGMKNNTIKMVYAYEFKGDAKDLKLEEGMATSLEFWKIDRIFHLTDEERKEFISSIIDDEYKNIFNRIKDLSEK
jgi:isopentenyl-diphosphate delta-isomerase type 1